MADGLEKLGLGSHAGSSDLPHMLSHEPSAGLSLRGCICKTTCNASKENAKGAVAL